MTYQPKPICTRDIELPLPLEELGEKLAENVHELWARKRLEEGWCYGTERDDMRKTTPCLVPFSDLPEGEKEYDRTIIQETLKAILALGFRVEPNNRFGSTRAR